MIELGTGHATSTSTPQAFFDRWVDHDSWPAWSPDTEWVRLDDPAGGPAAVGTTGVLKPVGGPKVKFEVTACSRGEDAAEYTDTSRLPGARLVFRHTAVAGAAGTDLDVLVSVHGPLGRLWARIMGGGFKDSAQADLDRLVALVSAADQAIIDG